MKIILNPLKDKWEDLSRRPGIDKSELEDIVRDIIYRVKSEKDDALFSLSAKYDNVVPGNLKVSEYEINEASGMVPDELKKAINIAKHNIENFHSAQQQPEPAVITSRGIKCWRKSVPVEKVGLYIPGGSAPLFSTVLRISYGR